VVTLLVVTFAAGLAIQPEGAVRRWEISTRSNQTLYLTKTHSLRYHKLRGLWATSYRVKQTKAPPPRGASHICEQVDRVEVFSLYGLSLGEYWIGCGGAESGFV
jgi:hypothetical protein